MKKIIKEISSYILIIIFVLLLKLFIITPIKVVGPSMMHTLLDGDIMLLEKVSYRLKDIKRFDIVVIKGEDKDIIKRVIGLPNDKIEYKNNELYINGKYYSENYLDGDTITEDFDFSSLGLEEVVPKDCYFVLGDNREESKDSRTIGFVKKSDIKGRAFFILFPLNRIGNR